MITRRTLLAATLALPATAHATDALTFRTTDNVTIFATKTTAIGPRHGTILLFHMAGSNQAEYTPIAPQLAKLGWDSIAIDQRSGGTLWGKPNQTVQHRGPSTDFAAAIPDLEATLANAGPGKTLIWGSSYSAALVFLLAAAHPAQIAGLLAFSPGEFIAGHSVRAAAAKLTCPIFVTSAADPGEIAAARTILAAAPSTRKTQFVPRDGVHGSSTLRADSNPSGVTENWQAVKGFLESVG